jgi:hypothetical protein
MDWVLWYHDPENRDYTLGGYVRVAELKTPQQFWSVVDAIPQDAWECGMFFFMKQGIRPIWDVPENEAGGSWSKKVPVANIHNVFIDVMVQCLTNTLLTKRQETLAGITISPKGPFSIIKVWNTTASVNDRHILNQEIPLFRIGDDVTYTAHKSRRT